MPTRLLSQKLSIEGGMMRTWVTLGETPRDAGSKRSIRVNAHVYGGANGGVSKLRQFCTATRCNP